MKQVAIGIQARTTSTRLPGKIFKKISSNTVLDHVVAQAAAAMLYLNALSNKNGITVKLFILIPDHDLENFQDIELGIGKLRPPYELITGPEEDVLTRYMGILNNYEADYICRITSDCPFIPTPIITKTITTAAHIQKGPFDFVTNASPQCRTFFDGADCEVMSRKCLEWLDFNAKSPSDREHVTQLLYNGKVPQSFKMAHLFTHLDTSKEKYSIDTEEDLNLARKNYELVKSKMKIWNDLHGPSSVFRF